MGLLAFGINHKTASVALRERAAFVPDSLHEELRRAVAATGLPELAILSTCNRTEFYAIGDAGHMQRLRDWLSRERGIAAAELDAVWYSFAGPDAVRHAMQVAAGLDSMILGEPQIFGQVKAAFAEADAAGTLGGELRRLSHGVFAAVKQVRSQTAIGASPVSIGYAAVNLARQVFSSLVETPVLLVGAGEMNQLVARHLREQGVRQLTVVNRSLANAQALAVEVGGEARPWSALAEALAAADMVVSCTASLTPVITRDLLQPALRRRRHRPQLMIDIAVPRDIDPALAELEDVFLYTIDDLQSVVDAGLRQRQQAAREAQQLIDQHVRQFAQQQRIQQDAAALIARLRRQAGDLVEEERQRALDALRAGADAEQVLARLQHNMLNRWLHAPTVGLRQLAADGDLAQLSLVARALGLPPDDAVS